MVSLFASYRDRATEWGSATLSTWPAIGAPAVWASLAQDPVLVDDHDPAGTLGRAQQQRLRVAPLVDVDVRHQDVSVKHGVMSSQAVTVQR